MVRFSSIIMILEILTNFINQQRKRSKKSLRNDLASAATGTAAEDPVGPGLGVPFSCRLYCANSCTYGVFNIKIRVTSVEVPRL